MKKTYIAKPFYVKPVHTLMIKWLRHKGDLTTSWEKGFLKDIKNKQKYSSKQMEKLFEIYTKLREGKSSFAYVMDESDYMYIGAWRD